MSGERVVFALSGGGARGAVQVGMLKALTERGIAPSAIVGASAGAVNAAWYALHPGRLDDLEGVWLDLRRGVVFPGTALHFAYNWVRRGHIHAVAGWHRLLRAHFGEACFEDAHIPLGVIGSRLSDGEAVCFTTGPVLPSLLASTAVPGLFPPQCIQGDVYVDGGLAEFLPLPTATSWGARIIYALDCGDLGWGPVARQQLLDRCAQIGATAWTRLAVAAARATGCRVIVLRPPLSGIADGRDFRHTARFIEAGYEYAARELERVTTEARAETATAL